MFFKVTVIFDYQTIIGSFCCPQGHLCHNACLKHTKESSKHTEQTEAGHKAQQTKKVQTVEYRQDTQMGITASRQSLVTKTKTDS